VARVDDPVLLLMFRPLDFLGKFDLRFGTIKEQKPRVSIDLKERGPPRGTGPPWQCEGEGATPPQVHAKRPP